MAKMEMDKDGFSLTPIDVTEDFWFYDGKKGLTVVVRPALGAGAITTIIPWRKLLPSVARYSAYRKRADHKKKSRART